MSTPKEFGKLIEELTRDELLRERERCKMMLTLYGPKRPAGKGCAKRLHAVERRLAMLNNEGSAD